MKAKLVVFFFVAIILVAVTSSFAMAAPAPPVPPVPAPAPVTAVAAVAPAAPAAPAAPVAPAAAPLPPTPVAAPIPAVAPALAAAPALASPPAPTAGQVWAEASVTAQEAQDIALDYIGEGVVARIEVKSTPHSGAEYVVIVVDSEYKYDVSVNGYTGDINDVKTHQINKISAQAYNYLGSVICSNIAKAIADEISNGGVVVECNLEYKPHDSSLIYHIHVMNNQSEYCVKLNAITGLMIEFNENSNLPAPGVDYQWGEATITVEEAQDIALEYIGVGVVARIEEIYKPHRGAGYSIIVINGDNRYDVQVNGYTGAVTEMKMKQITKVSPQAYYYIDSAIIANDAKALAIEEVGGGIVIDCNLELKPHNGLVYHIHLIIDNLEYCVEIDAITGSLIKCEARYTPGAPVPPADPTDPNDPTNPTDPTYPDDPTDPKDPNNPTDPVDPTEPTDPVDE